MPAIPYRRGARPVAARPGRWSLCALIAVGLTLLVRQRQMARAGETTWGLRSVVRRASAASSTPAPPVEEDLDDVDIELR